MRSFHSMKYQILAAAALLLSGPYIAAAEDLADQAQWHESIPLSDDFPESVVQLAHYDELYKKHKDAGLVVIAIHSAEEADDVDAFIAERGYTLPIAVDEGASAQRYGVWNFPQSVLLDRDCRIAWLSAEGEAPSQAQLNYLLDDTDKFPTH